MDGEELGTVTTIQDIVGRARTREVGCARRAREHELAYRRWRFWSALLGVLTAIGSAVAASALLLSDTDGAGAIACGIIALLAAAFATVNVSFLHSRVEENRAARAAFTSLRSRYHLLRDLPPKELPTAKAQLEDIERGHAQAELDAPPRRAGPGSDASAKRSGPPLRTMRTGRRRAGRTPRSPSRSPSRTAPRPVTPAPARTAPRPDSR